MITILITQKFCQMLGLHGVKSSISTFNSAVKGPLAFICPDGFFVYSMDSHIS